MSGNVYGVCRNISADSGADLLRIEPEKVYPDKGMKKFLWGGKCALMGEKPALKPFDTDPSAYDAFVIAYPVWASTYAPPIGSFIEQYRDAIAGKPVAALACFAGSGAEKSLAKLKAALGVNEFIATGLIQDPYPKKPEIKQTRKESIRRFTDTIRSLCTDS